MSRSLRQLWDVRERYIREERGWAELLNDHNESDEEHENEMNDDDDSLPESPECVEKKRLSKYGKDDNGLFENEKETDNVMVQQRLDTVDAYYVSPMKNSVISS